jgi:hypothetical protein
LLALILTEAFIIFTIVICLLGLNLAVAPYNVLVLESSACGNCAYFNSRDIKQMTDIENYQSVVNMQVIPAVHLKRTKVEGKWVYTHYFGAEFFTKASYQMCANGLYSNDRALKWGAFSNLNRRTAIADNAKAFFTEDSGAKIMACVNGPQAQEMTNVGYNIYRKNRRGGRLPFIIIDGAKTCYKPFSDGYFLASMCKRRSDRTEVKACDCLDRLPTGNGLKFLENFKVVDETEKCNISEVENSDEADIDFEKFWAAED